MVDIVVTQRVKPGMEQAFEALARQLAANTLANDEGCLRYEWYRAAAPQTYILIERWTEMAAAPGSAQVRAHRSAHAENSGVRPRNVFGDPTCAA